MRYTVSADLLVPVLLEIEGTSEDDVLDKLHAMAKGDLLRLANTENDSMASSTAARM